ncbi:SURF1 family protein [Leekyejoonella antrihumi]|uniref:SURF1-like protein n=1 Tax=Leekyejoonella antrihumi TaxID=1660198 RepID=A0A563E184_9MICO|nr:SURF1 family protein [Leekyejoonella antrihumi]TWP36155.1 SURF1 family protein [Leekyejoonella antrihumi]
MLRTALTPRWLGWLVVLLAIVVILTELGFWQLGVARDKGVDKTLLAAPTRPVVPMKTLLQVGDPFPAKGSSRRVSVRGHYPPSFMWRPVTACECRWGRVRVVLSASACWWPDWRVGWAVLQESWSGGRGRGWSGERGP